MEVFLGTIMPFAFQFTPRGWASCNGQLLSISANTALYSLLGTTYGGNGQSTFALPDIQGRTLIGQGTSTSRTTYEQGETAGNSTTTLTIVNLPMHNHLASATIGTPVYSETGNSSNAQGRSFATLAGTPFTTEATDLIMAPFTAPVTLQPAGNSQAASIENPFLVLNYQIALEGIFPSRN